jgi:hypothetical protein
MSVSQHVLPFLLSNDYAVCYAPCGMETSSPHMHMPMHTETTALHCNVSHLGNPPSWWQHASYRVFATSFLQHSKLRGLIPLFRALLCIITCNKTFFNMMLRPPITASLFQHHNPQDRGERSIDSVRTQRHRNQCTGSPITRCQHCLPLLLAAFSCLKYCPDSYQTSACQGLSSESNCADSGLSSESNLKVILPLARTV